MDFATLITVVPLLAMVAGALAGFGIGYRLSNRAALFALGGVALVSVGLLIYLATMGEGEEARVFPPFVTLTGGVFPALFGGIPGWLCGKALRRRKD